ncbi:Ribosomal large subunit pseudouridine synthase C [compost metagenome]
MKKQRPTFSNQPDKQAPHEKTTHWDIEQPTELMKFLVDNLPSKGRNTIKGILARGQISVNNKETTQFNYPLQNGDRVSIQWNKEREEDKPIGLVILHEDDDIIIINKEAGLLSIAAGEEKDLTAHHQLMEHVRKKHAKNRVYIVHRLDRDTSGVMIFAKNEKVKHALQDAWQEAIIERTYIALVERKVKKPEGKIVSWLKESKTLMMYSSPTPNGGQEAITHYKVLKSSPDYSLLEVHLETGRKNQIRVHMQVIGHPIIGDKKYGSTKNNLGRLGLHAQVLTFTHPTTGQTMRFETPVPGKFLRFFS